MKNVLSLLLLLFLASTAVQAQKKPCFKVYDVATKQEIQTICVGQKIKVVNCDPVPPTTIQYYDFDARDQVRFEPTDTVNTHIYSLAQNYRISFLPVDPNSPQSDSISKSYPVMPLPDPVFQVLGCTQRQVQVSITDTHYDVFEVQFAGGPSTTLGRKGKASYQFPAGQPMKVQVTARYNQATCSKSAERTVQELPAPGPARLTKVQVPVPAVNGRLVLSLDQVHPAYIYLVEKQNGAGFTVLDTIKNPPAGPMTKVLNQVNTQDQGCYRIRVTDACGTMLNVVSNTICSLPMLITGNQQISLTWPAYPDQAQISGYQLYRNGQPYRSLPKTQTSFVEEKTSCDMQYCYELVALLTDNNQSVSNNPCISLSTTTPPATPVLSSTFTPENRVQIRFQVPASQATGQITYQKSGNNAGFQVWQVSTARSVEDNNINKNQVICYQAQYSDSCNQVSPMSAITCPIVLELRQGGNNTVALSWSAYTGHPGPVAYVLQRLDAAGTVVSATPVSGTSFQEALPGNTSQKLFYRIQGLLNGQEATYSNTESLAVESQAWIPTAFTPNGDNLNDVFEVKGRFVELTRLRIYDRWGQIIFQSQGQGWNGRIKGQEAPPGTYPYTVEWKDENGRTMFKKGNVTLLK